MTSRPTWPIILMRHRNRSGECPKEVHMCDYGIRRLASGRYAYYYTDTGVVWHIDEGQLLRMGA